MSQISVKQLLSMATVVCVCGSASTALGQTDPNAALAARLDAVEKQLKELDVRLGDEVKKVAEANAASTRQTAADLAQVQQAVVNLRDGVGDVMTKIGDEDEAQSDASDGWDVKLGGYVMALNSVVFDDDNQTDFVGRNNGFRMGNARLELDAAFGPRARVSETNSVVGDGIYTILSLDGAVRRFEGDNSPANETHTELKDAYVRYAIKYVAIAVGQFKPPFDGESLKGTFSHSFIHRSLESRGIQGTEGYNADGFGASRQAGAMFYGGYDFASKVGLRAYVAQTNGNDAPFQNYEASAFYGRAEVLYSDAVTLGGAVKDLRRSTGQAPDLLDQREFAMAFDLDVDFHDVLLSAQYIGIERSFPDVDAEATRQGTGYHGSVGYRLPFFAPMSGVVLAYRYGWLDPLTDNIDTDNITHHTLALDFPASEQWPMRVAVNYTITVEDSSRQLQNDQLDILVGATF